LAFLKGSFHSKLQGSFNFKSFISDTVADPGQAFGGGSQIGGCGNVFTC